MKNTIVRIRQTEVIQISAICEPLKPPEPKSATPLSNVSFLKLTPTYVNNSDHKKLVTHDGKKYSQKPIQVYGKQKSLIFKGSN